MAQGFPDRGKSCALSDTESRCAEVQRSFAGLLCLSRWNAGYLPATGCSPAPKDAESTHGASCFDGHFLKGIHRRIPGLLTIQFQNIHESLSQTEEQFVSGLLLSIDSRHFLHPTDPPVTVSPDDCCICRFHKGIVLQRNGVRKAGFCRTLRLRRAGPKAPEQSEGATWRRLKPVSWTAQKRFHEGSDFRCRIGIGPSALVRPPG